MKRLLLIMMALAATGCSGGNGSGWKKEEKVLLDKPSSIMRVLTVNDEADSLVLRTPSEDIPLEAVASPEYRKLAEKMIATVTSPEQDGVGIAGPQVGILRRVVAVQRVDKEGEPFEVYPNIRITAVRGEKSPGGEGCLSVPDRRGNVLRYQDIDIQYTSPVTLRDTVETVRGFAAVIFQHETDHLDGVLYIDKLVEE